MMCTRDKSFWKIYCKRSFSSYIFSAIFLLFFPSLFCCFALYFIFTLTVVSCRKLWRPSRQFSSKRIPWYIHIRFTNYVDNIFKNELFYLSHWSECWNKWNILNFSCKQNRMKISWKEECFLLKVHSQNSLPLLLFYLCCLFHFISCLFYAFTPKKKNFSIISMFWLLSDPISYTNSHPR